MKGFQMKKYIALLCFTFLFQSIPTHADSVILMIGDGMGKNHIHCVAQDENLFLETLKPITEVKTSSANQVITDSAAAGTAYACGIKTNNTFLGVTPDGKACTSLAELAVQNGKKAYLISSDILTGATPSAFYAHVPSRYETSKILVDYAKAQRRFYTDFNVSSVHKATTDILSKLKDEKNDFFVMIEGAKIDKASHKNDYQTMHAELVDFDKAVAAAFEFAGNRDDVHVIVTADHETGGLDESCQYHLDNHTNANVWLFAKTTATIPTEPIENTDVNKIIRKIMKLPQLPE